ncbi:MAG: 3,4-dihydroxy-2-butanone-4-phosphate synthase, partial [Candidatus Binataceae bacterium]
MPIDSLDEVFNRLKAGAMVVLVTEERGEAQGDVVMAAQMVTPDHVNFMVREARGIVTIAITEQRMRELGIP